MTGVGAQVAAQLLVTAGDNPHRLRSEAAFARLCGVAPLPASSGKTTRHRLNRAGDRSANHALWRIAMVRLYRDPRTQAYVARRTAEGLSKREILRCLKRYIAREIFRVITDPPPAIPPGAELRRLRHERGLPLRAVAARHGITVNRLSDIERARVQAPETRQRIHAWLSTLHCA